MYLPWVRGAGDYTSPFQTTIYLQDLRSFSHTRPLARFTQRDPNPSNSFVIFDIMRNGMRYYAGAEDQRRESHFLKACFLCRRPLGFNRDIFMYRGNTPFCSKECRQEQIEIDEAQEKSWRIASSSSSSSSTASNAHKTKASNKKNVRSDTVAVA